MVPGLLWPVGLHDDAVTDTANREHVNGDNSGQHPEAGALWGLRERVTREKMGENYLERGISYKPREGRKNKLGEKLLMHQHKSITTLQGEDIVFLATDINLPGAVDWVMMQSCFGFHFMLVLEKQEKYDGHQQFFAIVQLIGTRKQAENFAYRLELNGHRRRLTWEATPRSIHEGIATAIMNSDCLVFDTSIAQLFAENGNLGINVTISMC